MLQTAYEFRHEDTGDYATIDFQFGQAPSIGKYVKGTRWRRVPSMPVKPVVREIRFKAYSQPPYAEGAPHYDADGTPCFSSRREVERYVATQNRLTDKDGRGQQGGEYIEYDVAPTKG